MYLDGEKRPALTPQLAWRIAILGGIALVAFAVIFFRLWYLQVLSGDKYLAEARGNQVRSIKVQAPRGEIVDRDGRVLVDNAPGRAVVVTPDKLPEDEARRQDLYRRLGRLVHVKPRRIEREIDEQLKALPYASAMVKADVSDPVVRYLLERRSEFPGVDVQQVYLRDYPHGDIGAHLFGYVGEVNAEELKSGRFRGAEQGDRVGKQGIEAEYDNFLRGRNGASRLQVDAMGNLKKTFESEEPEQGRQLRLSIDLDVQNAGQEALASGTGKGAFVVMNIHDGQVLGLGSAPSFDPNIFSKPISQKTLDALYSEDNGKPLFNRAIQGGYPSGSTYKLVTALGALEGGLITPDEIQYDTGSLKVGGVEFKNAGDAVHGAVNLQQAMTVSSDVYFYLLGQKAFNTGDGQLLQHWAHKLGIGRKTGIDLPGEAAGTLPTEKWRNALYREFEKCKDRKKPTPAQIYEGICGFADRPWSVGDNINLSVGQGDLAVDPLQMAVAYAAVANGGKVLKPRLGMRIEDSNGRALQRLEAPVARRIKIDPAYSGAILEGLRGAAQDPGGTSTPVFEGFPIPIAGKTGTAEKGGGRPDQSWYAALAPYPDPKYVVVVTDEAGGFGADTAAPMARRILAALFDVKNDEGGQAGTAPD
jgi:penicillin-binding protein 2